MKIQQAIKLLKMGIPIFKYSRYWHTWSRLIYTDGFNFIEVDLTPVNSNREGWEKVLSMNIRCHCTSLKDGDILTEEPPNLLKTMMSIFLGRENMTQLMELDFLNEVQYLTNGYGRAEQAIIEAHKHIGNGGASWVDTVAYLQGELKCRMLDHAECNPKHWSVIEQVLQYGDRDEIIGIKPFVLLTTDDYRDIYRLFDNYQPEIGIEIRNNWTQFFKQHFGRFLKLHPDTGAMCHLDRVNDVPF